MATSIDDNAADEKSDKSKWQLLNIHCTSLHESERESKRRIKADFRMKNSLQTFLVYVKFIRTMEQGI